MKKILLAFQFLTIVPVRVNGDFSEKDMARSASFFPLVGAFQGLLIALPSLLLMKVLPADVTSGILIVLSILGNGGFDLDGLADTADALAVKSTGNAEADREKRLSVMKDSSVGAMGVIALVTAILLKYLFINRLVSDSAPFTYAALLFLMPAFSKWITVPAMYHGVSARRDGLGKIFLEHTGPKGVLISSLIVIGLFFTTAWLDLLGLSFVSAVQLCALLCVSFYLICLVSVRFLTQRFGGLTGDHFGALTEISEILYLATVYLWLRHSTS